MLKGIKFVSKDNSVSSSAALSSSSSAASLKRDDWMSPPTGDIFRTAPKKVEEKKSEEKPKPAFEPVLHDKTKEKDGLLVGDGGASWRLKAKLRAQQRAEEEGTVSFEFHLPSFCMKSFSLLQDVILHSLFDCVGF